MELNLIRNISRRGILLFVAVIIGAIVFWLGYLFITQPNPAFGQLPEPNIQSLVSTKTEWLVSGSSATNLPSKAPVYEVLKRGLTKNQVLSLARNFGFPNTFKTVCSVKSCNGDDNLLTFQEENSTLTIDKLKGVISFKKPNLLKNELKGLSYEDLINKTEDFLKLADFDLSGLQVQRSQTKYYQVKSNSLTEVTTFNNATVIELVYRRFINNWEIINYLGTPYVTVQITKNGEMFSFSGLKTEIEENDDVTYPILSFSAAKNALVEGSGYLARFTESSYGSSELVNPTLVNVRKGQVLLFDDGEGNFIEPIFVFDSVAVKESQSAQAEVYLPAIKPDLLSD